MNMLVVKTSVCSALRTVQVWWLAEGCRVKPLVGALRWSGIVTSSTTFSALGASMPRIAMTSSGLGGCWTSRMSFLLQFLELQTFGPKFPYKSLASRLPRRLAYPCNHGAAGQSPAGTAGSVA